MAFGFISRVNRHKRFNFAPRYYDERKEMLELKRKKFQDGRLDSGTHRSELLRDSIQQSWSRGKYVRKQKQSANMRIVILVVLIVLFGYFILNGLDDIDQVIKAIL